jgi:metal-responsive CopG/Arc/MetJ family transcriptional regulator
MRKMKTVQMTLDEDLVEAVDRVARKLGTSGPLITALPAERM